MKTTWVKAACHVYSSARQRGRELIPVVLAIVLLAPLNRVQAGDSPPSNWYWVNFEEISGVAPCLYLAKMTPEQFLRRFPDIATVDFTKRKASGGSELIASYTTKTGSKAFMIFASDEKVCSTALSNIKRLMRDSGEQTVGQLEKRRKAPKKQWYSVDDTSSECFATGGPAELIDRFGKNDRIETKDYKDGTGIFKVEVQNWDMKRVWTYYRDQSTCTAEKVLRNKALADKYR